MSGGSFNYLCYKDADQLHEYITEIEQMADALDGYGQHMLAVRTRALATGYREMLVKCQKEIELMRPVWYAVEWCQSGDTGEDQLKEAFDKYWGVKQCSK